MLTVFLGAIVAFGVTDLVLDQPLPALSFHAIVEFGFIGTAIGATVYLWSGWARERRSLERTRTALSVDRAERDLWRSRTQTLLQGLGEEIDAQLRRWNLTPAERETALFLLKGFEHKEIAALLGKSERTVRQQAGSVYHKANLSSRAELSAFFLEDLLLPLEDREPHRATREDPAPPRRPVGETGDPEPVAAAARGRIQD